MIIEDKILVKNYKCFDSEGAGFEKIYPINIIIGKNNSGKSSLVELIKCVIKRYDEFYLKGRENIGTEIIIAHKLTDEEIAISFKAGVSGGGIPNNHLNYGLRFSGKMYSYKLNANGKNTFNNINEEFITGAKKYFEELAFAIKTPLFGKLFCNIAAERDLVSEIGNSDIILAPNGSGATNYIQQIINKTKHDSRLIEEELLRELNVIINPDIKFNRILVQEDENNRWEIYFEDFMLNRIQLSRMGSGIKTILLVLLNLIVRPKIENNDRNVYVYAFEELENNLHPSLQRRLYNYIIKYSENHLTYFFITTHSNVVIDVFSSYEKSQLIHVLNNGSFSRTNTILSKAGTKHILDDLGLKASDILQSNGVIWVEGPSDRNYINKWIKTLCPELSEGMHYLVMFYGGRLLSNLTFDIDWFNEEVIPLLRINKNAFVVIDRDGKKINDNINETKSRIVKEIGVNSCWVTSGREIENYLSSKIVSRWLLEKHKVKVDFTQDKYVKIEENILKSGDKIRVKYNESKTVYSSELSKYIDIESLDILDLRENLEKLVEKIKLWNELG